MLKRFVVAFASLALFLAAFAAAAGATTRYADPSGVGAFPCGGSDPCSLANAISTALAGDEVIVQPGTYTPSGDITIGNAIDVHGTDAAPATVNGVSIRIDAGGSLRNLKVTNGTWPIITATGSMDRVWASSTSNGSWGCRTDPGTFTVTNSVCAAPTGDMGIGTLFPTSDINLTLRGVTAVGGINGINLTTTTRNLHINAYNTIAVGSTDVYGQGTNTTITLDHSNFQNTDQQSGAVVSAAGSGTNQVAEPQFVNAAAGNYHQVKTSPTIDAGLDSIQNGNADIDGDARIIGARTDIGADEYSPQLPVAVPDSVTVAQDSGPTVISVLANETNPDNAPLLVQGIQMPSHGTAQISNLGTSVTYTPAAGYCGPDSFAYSLSSGSSAVVTVTVTCPQAPPPGGGTSDTTAPNTKLGKGPKKKSRARLAKATFSSTEAGSRFECKLDRKPWNACTSPFKRKVAVGKHTLLVRATDAAGNTDPTPLKITWKVTKKKKHR